MSYRLILTVLTVTGFVMGLIVAWSVDAGLVSYEVAAENIVNFQIVFGLLITIVMAIATLHTIARGIRAIWRRVRNTRFSEYFPIHHQPRPNRRRRPIGFLS